MQTIKKIQLIVAGWCLIASFLQLLDKDYLWAFLMASMTLVNIFLGWDINDN